ncbi:protein kinase [Streptomyces sp. NPDC058374]|uniref:protein kinase domain-containing protein n=1 Tax=Streptomyces sp. NPDC058374 TaxID=3346466 RepID=UPI003662E4A2
MSQDGAQGRYAGRAVAGGRYQLRDLLGEGGMASVHLAYDSVLDRQVAIKTLHTELGREAAFRERFRREAQSVAKLTHTNIVSVFDTGEDDLGGTATPYIVMEYVEGRPLGSVLDDAVARQGAMPADQALKITADVLAALEISHEMGLVHRDIKPGNVMMTKRGVVKVMDFGIARAMQSGVTSMTQTGMVVGTPQYLSPEQALGRGVDARSDLYSVGIMLFQLVTGRLPFEADSPLAIAYAHVQEEPVPPSSVNRALPPAVDALVARALKKNPNERFPTAESMRDECLRIAQSLQPAAPSIVPGSQTQSGAGVGSAVFPPVGQQPPSTGPVQTPYQPGPYTAQTPPPQHHPVPTPAPGYGYPQQSGYATPQPYGHHQAPATPPPYAVQQQGQDGGGKRPMPLIAGSIVVALLAIGGLVTALALQNDDENKAGGSGDPGTSQGEEKGAEKPGFRGPDLTKTMDVEECTEPDESYNDPDKIRVPDFTFTNITFVKKCMQAAKWKYDTTSIDENAYGKDTVMRQTPKAGSEVDPDDMPEIQLDVSSGNPS